MQKQRTYKVSVPGSLMLFGEHAVLHGSPALVAAIDKRIHASLTPRQDKIIKVTSLLGELELSLNDLNNRDYLCGASFEYVFAAMQLCYVEEKFSSGFDLQITADFAANLGFGSSAAVTVAVLAILHIFAESFKHTEQKQLMQLDKHKLLLQAKSVIRKVQGVGSGADAAASIFGGVVLYRMEPPEAERIASHLPLTVVYSGSKKATREVIAKVEELRNQQPQIFHILCKAISDCVLQSVSLIKKQDWRSLGEIMNIHHGLQVTLGTSNLLLEELVFELRTLTGMFGAKISGSGLGDCVIGCGALNEHFPKTDAQLAQGVKQIEVNVVESGICCM